MLKLELRECLNNISIYIYDRNVDDVFEKTELAVMDLFGHLNMNTKESRNKFPTEYKVIKTAYTDWNINGSIRSHYEVN